MLQYFKTLGIFLALFGTLQMMAQAENHKLSISFTGLSSAKGNLMLKVSDEAGQEVLKKVVPLESQGPTVRLSLPKGNYAIAAFHDENSNKKLDRNFAGLPKEKYGFSNNVRGTFGPPALVNQLIKLAGELEIEIRLE